MKYGNSSGLIRFLAPELDRVEVELVDRGVDQALDHEIRDLGAEAAIGALLALVGQHRGDVGPRRCGSGTARRSARERVAVMADAELEVGAVIVDHLAAPGRSAPVGVERELGLVDRSRAVLSQAVMLSMRSSTYFTGRPVARASVAAITGTLCRNSLLPKLPPASVGTMLSLCAGTPSEASGVQPT